MEKISIIGMILTFVPIIFYMVDSFFNYIKDRKKDIEIKFAIFYTRTFIFIFACCVCIFVWFPDLSITNKYYENHAEFTMDKYFTWIYNFYIEIRSFILNIFLNDIDAKSEVIYNFLYVPVSIVLFVLLFLVIDEITDVIIDVVGIDNVVLFLCCLILKGCCYLFGIILFLLGFVHIWGCYGKSIYTYYIACADSPVMVIYDIIWIICIVTYITYIVYLVIDKFFDEPDKENNQGEKKDD